LLKNLHVLAHCLHKPSVKICNAVVNVFTLETGNVGTSSPPKLVRISLAAHIRIFASESTFMPNDVGRSRLKSKKPDSRSNNEIKAM